MKIFKIPVTWSCFGVVEIEANTIQEALKIAEDENIPLPEGDYVDGSWEINNDSCLIKALNEE